MQNSTVTTSRNRSWNLALKPDFDECLARIYAWYEQFNNQLASHAGKVGEERTARVLPSELQAAQTLRSHDIPKKRFCFHLTLAKFTIAIGAWIGGHDRPLNRNAK